MNRNRTKRSVHYKVVLTADRETSSQNQVLRDLEVVDWLFVTCMRKILRK